MNGNHDHPFLLSPHFLAWFYNRLCVRRTVTAPALPAPPGADPGDTMNSNDPSPLNHLLLSKMVNGSIPVNHGSRGWFGLAFVVVALLLLGAVLCAVPYFGFLSVSGVNWCVELMKELTCLFLNVPIADTSRIEIQDAALLLSTDNAASSYNLPALLKADNISILQEPTR